MQMHGGCREPDASSLNGLASFSTRLAVLHSNGSRGAFLHHRTVVLYDNVAHYDNVAY